MLSEAVAGEESFKVVLVYAGSSRQVEVTWGKGNVVETLLTSKIGSQLREGVGEDRYL